MASSEPLAAFDACAWFGLCFFSFMQGVMLEDVAAVLRSRFGKSGIEEKASRKKDVAQA